MNPLHSLSMFRSLSDLAGEAAQSISRTATRLTSAVQPSGQTEFASYMQVDQTDQLPSISDLRQSLSQRVESLLKEMRIAPDPALTIQVSESGRVQLESDHAGAAELEAVLNDDPAMQELANQLAATATSAERRFVIHSVDGSRG